MHSQSLLQREAPAVHTESQGVTEWLPGTAAQGRKSLAWGRGTVRTSRPRTANDLGPMMIPVPHVPARMNAAQEKGCPVGPAPPGHPAGVCPALPPGPPA